MTDPTPFEPAAGVAGKIARARRLTTAAGRDRLGQVHTRVRHRLDRRAVTLHPSPDGPRPPATIAESWPMSDGAPGRPAVPDARPDPRATLGHTEPVIPGPVVSGAVVPPAVRPQGYYTIDPLIPVGHGGVVVPRAAAAPVRRPFHWATVFAVIIAFIFPPAGLRMAERVRVECRRENLRGEIVALVAYLFSAINTLGLTLVALSIGATFAYGMYKLGSGVAGIGAGMKSIGEFLTWVRRGFS